MNPPSRRKVSLAGLGLIGAGGVLGLALGVPAQGTSEAGPASASSAEVARPAADGPAPEQDQPGN